MCVFFFPMVRRFISLHWNEAKSQFSNGQLKSELPDRLQKRKARLLWRLLWFFFTRKNIICDFSLLPLVFWPILYAVFVVFCSTIGDSESIIFKKPKQFCLEQTRGGSLFVWTRSGQRVSEMELKSDPEMGISTKALMELLELEILILLISSCLLKIPSLWY